MGFVTPSRDGSRRSRGGFLSGSPIGLDDPSGRVAELQAIQQQTGAPGIEQDKPGVFRRILDVLSRPNYAIAGFVEEVGGEEPSVTRGVKRALTEIFSGVGGLQGEKRAFGEVLENLGVGTTTLADAFPALENTWVGNFGSRGAAGLALDIFTDPLTYMTFGVASAGRITAKVGGKQTTRFLNAAGMQRRQQITQEVLGSLGDDVLQTERRFAKKMFGEADEFSVRRARTRLGTEIDRRTVDALTDPKTGDIAKEFLDPGGARIFGKSVLKGEDLQGFYDPIVRAAEVTPVGKAMLDSGRAFRDGLRGSVNRLFHPFNELGNLPAAERDIAIRLRRDFQNASTAHRGRLMNQAKHLEKQYRQLEKADPLIGKRWYDVREGVRPIGDLPEAERVLYWDTMRMYDEMRDTLLAHGVLEPEQIRKGYIFHGYNNLDDLNKYHWATEQPFSGVLSEQFTKQRAWDTYDFSVTESRRLNAIDLASKSKRSGTRVYPILDPNYDVFDNLGRYVRLHADALARKSWREEIATQFGKNIDEFDINALYDVTAPFISPESTAYNKIVRFFENTPTFAAGRETAAEVSRIARPQRLDIEDGIRALDKQTFATSSGKQSRATTPTEGNRGFLPRNRRKGRELAEVLRRNGRLDGTDLVAAREIVLAQRAQVGDLIRARQPGRSFQPELQLRPIKRAAAEQQFIKRLRTQIRNLTGDDRREFIRQLMTRANSSSQVAVIERELWDEFEDYFPKMLTQATRDGEIAAPLAKTLGEQAAEMIPVKSAWTGDVGLHLPRAVWDDLQRVNSRLLNTGDFKEFGRLMRGFDWLNNRFKIGVYTLWPASASRDAYSNIALSMLDIGLQALNPKYHRAAVEIMAGRSGDVALGGIKYSYQQLRQMSKDLGVWVPGEVFAELAGDPKTAGTVLRKAANLRGLIENEARVMLWFANMRRGVDPRRAADHVAEFLFNYGEVSTVEREVFRRLIPFYTFTRKNVELQWKMLRRNPGMVANQLKPFRGRSEENEQMVQWEAEGLKLRMDKDGKTVHMLTGIDLPLRNVDALWRGDLGRTGRSIVGMITPIIKTVPEVLLNQDFFLGRDLTRTQSSAVGHLLDKLPTPKPVKDWLGYKKEVNEAGKPRYTFDGRRFTLLFRSWMLSRAVSTSDRQFRDNITNGGIEWQRMMLDVLTGIRRKDIDLTEQMDRKMRNRVRQLEESLARRGVMSEFRKRFTPKEQGELQ